MNLRQLSNTFLFLFWILQCVERVTTQQEVLIGSTENVESAQLEPTVILTQPQAVLIVHLEELQIRKEVLVLVLCTL